jgi:hypothetical protein
MHNGVRHIPWTRSIWDIPELLCRLPFIAYG